MQRFERRLFWAILYFNVVIAIGMVGYHRIEGWSWFDALYMAVTTATSVGYEEVHPLSPPGRAFTMGLLALSIVGLGLLWAVTTALFIELDLGDVYRRRRMTKQIGRTSHHYIVVGAGRVGRVIVQELVRAGATVVVVDSAFDRIERMIASSPDMLYVHGDATQDETLERAGISRARGMALALASDADNLFVCLTARDLNANLEIAVRATDEATISKLRRAGANHVVSPNVTGGVRMAVSLVRPSVVSFLDATTLAADVSLRLEESEIPTGSQLVGKTLEEARIPEKTGLILLALRRCESTGPAIFNPGRDSRLAAGDVMIVLGRQDQIERLRAFAAT